VDEEEEMSLNHFQLPEDASQCHMLSESANLIHYENRIFATLDKEVNLNYGYFYHVDNESEKISPAYAKIPLNFAPSQQKMRFK
jgi:hypothetical protein